MNELTRAGSTGLALAFIAMVISVQLSGCTDDESVSSSDWLLGSGWRDRLSGSPDVHLVSLPPTLSSYREAWVYQFGTNPATWNDNGHNMECGPACIQMMERLTGRDSVDCTYVASVPGCDDYPDVHSECRAAGVCGADRHLRGSSWLGTGSNEVSNLLEELGFETRVYHRSTTRVSLSIVKNAVLENHPIIVALSPRTYQSETGFGSGVDSHWVVVVGFGPVCENQVYGPDHPERAASGFVYMLDPGWSCGGSQCGAMACISEEMFNRALDAEYNPSTYSAVEVIRPGYEAFPSATWYPPGTLLGVDGEYYYVVQPDPSTGAPRVHHATIEALHSNRVSVERAIEVPRAALSCMDSLGDLDATRRFREYREPGGTIYLVDTVDRLRWAFLNLDSYLTQDGREEWRSTTASEIATWSRYPLGEAGLGPGTLVASDAPGVSSVWVVSVNGSGRVRLPIFNERTARIYGYDISGPRPRAFVRVHHADLDRLAGPVGTVLTEEMSRDCYARRCLAAVDCFSTGPSSIGGGDEGVGNGACTEGDCLSEPMSGTDGGPPTSSDSGVPSGMPCTVDRDCPGYGAGWRCQSGTCREADLDGDGYLGSDGDCNPDAPRIHLGAVETCDAVDEDCDVRVDEGFDLLSDPNNCGGCRNSCGSGMCSGGVCVESCALRAEVCGNRLDDNCNGTADEACAPVCTPAAEVCNNRDDDCDTLVDESLSRTCSTACGSGLEMCSAGRWVGCTAPLPGTEACDGRDEDCDGLVDEGVASIACSTICGSGVRSCMSGFFGVCSARSPTSETCNDRDDNCDGSIDERLTRTCSTICGGGNETCSGGGWIGCTAPVPVTEVCNTRDDDCDGRVDEGVCTPTCVPTSPAREMCDGRDNDCDGTIDNGCPAMNPYLVEIWMDPSVLDDCSDPGGFRINLWGPGGVALQNVIGQPFRQTITSSWVAATPISLSCSVAPLWYDWTGHVGEPSSLNGVLVMRMGGRDMLPTSLVCNDMVDPAWGPKPYMPLESRYEGSCMPRW